MRWTIPAWWSVIAGLLAVDWMLDTRHDGSTFSECTRTTFRTDTALGRFTFTAAWLAFSAWWVRHVLKPATREMS